MATYPNSIITLARQPSGFMPVVLSLAALALVLGTIATAGVARQPDEGAAAHIYQLLIAAQLPLLCLFMLRSVRKDVRAGLVIASIQVAALGAALWPVWYFGL